MGSLWETQEPYHGGMLASPFLAYFGRRPFIFNKRVGFTGFWGGLLPSMEEQGYVVGVTGFAGGNTFPGGFNVMPGDFEIPEVWEDYPWPWL